MGQYDAIRTLRSVTRSLKQPTNVSGGAVVIISGSGAHFHREMVDGKSTNKVVHAWSSSKRFSSWARVADTDPVPELCELAAGSPDCVGTRPASEQNVTTRSGDESRYQLATATAAREMRLLNDRSPFHLGMMIETPPEHFPEVQPPWQPPLQLPTASSTSERSWAGLLHRANPEAGTFERYTLSVALWVQAVLNASASASGAIQKAVASRAGDGEGLFGHLMSPSVASRLYAVRNLMHACHLNATTAERTRTLPSTTSLAAAACVDAALSSGSDVRRLGSTWLGECAPSTLNGDKAWRARVESVAAAAEHVPLLERNVERSSRWDAHPGPIDVAEASARLDCFHSSFGRGAFDVELLALDAALERRFRGLGGRSE